ncbi:BglG family transcription antiterminator [Paenibacillus sp. 1P07SE]|uniref:BglG family transcription antiterminator n=1 Tax=Paenibacillus sp. 1P07SE TaxID=3132209 RepID=UPI0039A633B2
MRLSARQSQLLKLLIEHAEGMTAGDLSRELGVSVRTIHRELPRVEEVLAAAGSSLIKQSGFGLRLAATAQQLTRLQGMLRTAAEYSPEERELLLACRLLAADEPIKQYALASELQVTIPTITIDLDELEQTLSRYRLTLLRKRGYGVQIEGDERYKREMISDLVMDVLDEHELYSGLHGRPLTPVSRPLAELAGIDSIQKLEQALWSLEQQFPSELTDTDYTKLLVQLSVAIARMRKGHVLPAQTVGETSERVSSEELELWTAAAGIALEGSERYYVQELLNRRASASALPLLLEHPRLQQSVHLLIGMMESELQAGFESDSVLREGLEQHLERALERMQRGETIRNPLLRQIKDDHEQLFEATAKTAREVYPGFTIPDEEIGFLAMHFGASLERAEGGGGNGLRALLVCTSGIGSSRLLAARLAKSFPRLHITGNVSWYEASRLPETEYDLILSTIDLPLPESRYVKLSPLLPERDRKMLRRFLRDIQPPVQPPAASPSPDLSSLYRLQELHRSADEMLQLLDRLMVCRLRQLPGDGMAELTSRLLALLEEQGHVVLGQQVADKVMVRESYGSLVLPESTVALLHTRSEHVAQPLLVLLKLEKPIIAGDPAGQIEALLYMLAPQELPAVQLSLLSEISAMLLEHELVRLLEAGSEQEIRQWLAGAWLDILHRV